MIEKLCDKGCLTRFVVKVFDCYRVVHQKLKKFFASVFLLDLLPYAILYHWNYVRTTQLLILLIQIRPIEGVNNLEFGM